jgi:signal transduction histidine kinase
MGSEEAEIKFFIHDLRVQKHLHHLINIHQQLIGCYHAANLDATATRHEDYLERLKRVRERAHEARVAYELAVRNKEGAEAVIRTGRVYIDKTLEVCRISLLPHWRDFSAFVEELPADAQCRRLETGFNECKAWLGSIDRRIIDFTRYNDREVPMEALEVAELIRSYVDKTLRYYVRTISSKRLEIRMGLLDAGYIYADRPRFKRLLFNLVMNAVDAMRHRKAGTILLEVKSSELIVSLEATDEGVGMSPDKVDQILHSEKDLTGELHSLGFRFVRQTVESFHGKIYVESEEGRGTTIRMDFPRYFPEEGESLSKPQVTHDPTGDPLAIELPGQPARVEGTERTGAIILEDFHSSKAQLPGCLFSIGIEPSGAVDHFVHRSYDPDWMMGHDDLAPMLYEAVFRGRYETDDRTGTALILKSPHKLEEYFDLRGVKKEERQREFGLRMMHNEYVLIARHLVSTGMDAETKVFATLIEQCFTRFGQKFTADPFALRELAEQPLL